MYDGGRLSGKCVYLLRDESNTVRYVGQGSLSRAEDSARSRGLGVEIVAVNMSKSEAEAMEARLIHLIGPERLLNTIIPPLPGERGMTWSAAHGPRIADPGMIRRFRKEHGLTQKDLAALLLLPNPNTGGQVTVARWEKGDQSPAPYLPLALEELKRGLTDV